MLPFLVPLFDWLGPQSPTQKAIIIDDTGFYFTLKLNVLKIIIENHYGIPYRVSINLYKYNDFFSWIFKEPLTPSDLTLILPG